jgi:DNA damage-binding protein 1
MNADGSRILLGDTEGHLHYLTLTMSQQNQVESLCFIGLGDVSTVFDLK